MSKRSIFFNSPLHNQNIAISGPRNKNYKSIGNLFSPTLKIQEDKVLIVLLMFAQMPIYGPIFILKSREKSRLFNIALQNQMVISRPTNQKSKKVRALYFFGTLEVGENG